MLCQLVLLWLLLIHPHVGSVCRCVVAGIWRGGGRGCNMSVLSSKLDSVASLLYLPGSCAPLQPALAGSGAEPAGDALP